MKILQIPTGGLFADGILSCIVEYMTAMDKSDMDIRVLATNQAEKVLSRKLKKSVVRLFQSPIEKQISLSTF